MTALGGQTPIMRRLLPALAAALVTITALAFADEPPSTPLSLSAPAAGSDLPDMGSPAAAVLSHTDEYRLGAMVAHQLRDQNALLEDPEISEYLQSVGLRLASQSADGGRDFQFFVIKDPSINAFAVPGGFVFVHDGLVLATSTESELASVMAHEIAHVTQHHIARMIRAQSQQSIASAAALLAAILLGAIGGGQAMEGGIAAAEGLAAQQQINFTRDNEKEADRVGIGYLAGAGFDTNSMGSFFETMSRHEGLAATYIPAMLIDHPVTSDRIAEARARAAQFAPRKGKDSQGYELIRERVRVLTATGDVDLAQAYAQKLAHGHATLGNRYGEALALMSANRADEATRILMPLVQQHEALTLLHVALGQAQAKAGHLHDALATFQHGAELFPRNVPLTVRYAETLMAAGRPADAHNMLLDLFNIVPPTPDQIRLTALAASAAGDAGDAYFYMGEYQIAGGDLALAAQQLQLALASPNISPIQRQRYQARLDEVRDYLASTRKRRLNDNGDGQGQQTGQRRGGGR
jgi:predicted Zn-dependent protease